MKYNMNAFRNLLFKGNRKYFSDHLHKRFDDKVIIITGGASGIGRATCIRAAQQGANVVIADINEKNGLSTISEIKQLKRNESLFVKTNMGEEEELENLVRETIKKFGRIDVVVNNAVDLCMKGLDATREEWIRTFLANQYGPVTLIKKSLEHLKKTKGCVVNVGSITSLISMPNLLVYSMGKAAITQMSRNLSLDLSKDNIRVNTVCPGFILTPIFYEAATKTGVAVEELMKPAILNTTLKRLGKPEEIADTILFLASPEASYINGSNLVVDGGYTIL